MNEDLPPRHNPHTGMECPPWCTQDHVKAGEFTRLSCIGSGGGTGPVWTRAFLGPHHGGNPVVAVTGSGDEEGETHHVELRPRLALHLAGLVELLAAATPDQHRELAAAIRKAASDITNETGEQQ